VQVIHKLSTFSLNSAALCPIYPKNEDSSWAHHGLQCMMHIYCNLFVGFCHRNSEGIGSEDREMMDVEGGGGQSFRSPRPKTPTPFLPDTGQTCPYRSCSTGGPKSACRLTGRPVGAHFSSEAISLAYGINVAVLTQPLYMRAMGSGMRCNIKFGSVVDVLVCVGLRPVSKRDKSRFLTVFKRP